MNQELSQQVVAAVVITALAAIFIPMLFDDPIDNSGQMVSQLPIPNNPANVVEVNDSLPDKSDDVVTPYLADQNQLSRLDKGLQTEPLPSSGDRLDRRVRDDENTSKAALDTGVVDETDPFDTADPFMSQHSDQKRNTTNDKLGNSAEAGAKKHGDQLKAKSKAFPAENYAAKDAALEKPPATKTKIASGSSRWYIQAGSFSKKENALALLETLKNQSLPVAMENKNSLYRLKVGEHLDKKQALLLKQKLDQLNVQNMLLPE